MPGDSLILRGRIAAKLGENIDTDIIYPGRYLNVTDREKTAEHLFELAFPEILPSLRPGDIILAGRNFGCGSSREHAPWGVKDYGFRAILAPSYADIFYNNCFKNGILPAILTEAEIDELFKRTEKEEGYSLSIDLPNQTVVDKHGLSYKFEITPARKEVLLKGLDDIGQSLQHAAAIDTYEKAHAATATMYEPVDVKYYSNGR